ncbi:hypothetical protein IQ229_14620 [Nostoc cf. edaphicum LEGE 07299]|uniref:Secreted protein n=1 Tax=Nostoc cf. edaphicum LEGE 07299 TaxID=2777974 RepID=A0ABR9U0D6_9NOSO|nr:hypothetical protein [Nostoc edaphicum]MBE9106129.1 hypothetical protein [Nostoc cf. edaphicum LEGE 07299]
MVNGTSLVSALKAAASSGLATAMALSCSWMSYVFPGVSYAISTPNRSVREPLYYLSTCEPKLVQGLL